MKIKKSRNLNISPKCIDDVGKEDVNQLRETVIFTRALSSEISSATPGSVHRAWFSDMNNNLLAEIDEMADKHGIDKKTFRSNCLSTEEYFSREEYDTAAVPEPTTTPPVKKRPKSTGKGHIRKLFTPVEQNKMSRRRLHPDKGPRARANRGESRGCTRSRFSSHGKCSKKRKRYRNRNKYGGRKSQGPGVTLPLPCDYPTKRGYGLIDYDTDACRNDTAVASSDNGDEVTVKDAEPVVAEPVKATPTHDSPASGCLLSTIKYICTSIIGFVRCLALLFRYVSFALENDKIKYCHSNHLRAGGRGRSTRSGSSDADWERTCQGYQARFRRSLTAGSIQQQSFPFSQEDSNACASIAMYAAIQYALTPSLSCVQDEDFRHSATSVGRDIAVETRFMHREGAGSYIMRDQFEHFFSGFIENESIIVCSGISGDDIYSYIDNLTGHLPDGSIHNRNVAITLNCDGHVFFLANRSDGAFDLIDSLPAEVFGTSSAFRITCNGLNELNNAVLCLLSSRSAGSAQSKAFDAVVYSGQSNTDIEGLDASVNFLIEESRSARGARDARVIEAPSAKSEVEEKRSRLDVAAEIDTSSFDEEQSISIVSASINSNNPTLEELNDALDHVDKCIKNCDGEDIQKKTELERQKVLLLIKFIPLHIKERPSDKAPNGSRRSSRGKKRLNKAAKKEQERKEKEVEKKRKEIRQTWSSTLVSAVSLLGRGVAILERSQLYKEEIDSFQQHHQTLLVDCIDATQPLKPTSKSTFTIVKFMEDNFVHINLLKAATKFMTDKESSHGVVRVLQEKLHFLDKALKTNMSPEAFLNEWNRLEEVDAEAVRQVICKEGLYVTVEDKKTGETKRICVVEPGSYWEQNVLTGVQLYRLAIALKNWHPPIKEKKKEGMTKKEDDDVEMEVDNKSEKKEAAKPDLMNGCLRGVNELGPRIVHIEGGGEMTEELRQQVIKAIAIFDLHDLFPKTKKYCMKEFREFARLSGLGSFVNFQLRGMIRLQAQLVLNKLCGLRSHMATFSAEAARAGFTLSYGAGVSADVTNAGTLPHGEAQCEPKIKMASNLYSYQDLLNHSAGLCTLFSPIAGMCISFMSVAMAIIARRHDDRHLSEEDEELLRDMKRQWCVDGYNAAIESVSINYSEEFSKYCEDILDVDVTSDNVDPKEIYECQKSFFGHRGGKAGYKVSVESVSIMYAEEFREYCLNNLKVDVTSDDVDPKKLFECQKSFFGHRGGKAGSGEAGYKVAVDAVSIKYPEEFRKYCEDILDVDVTSENVDPKEMYECQKSFFGHIGDNAAVEAVCLRYPEEFSKYSMDTFKVDVTSEDVDPKKLFECKKSFKGYHNGWEKKKEKYGGHDAAVQRMKDTGCIYEAGDKEESQRRAKRFKKNAIAKHGGDEKAAHQHLYGVNTERFKNNNPLSKLENKLTQMDTVLKKGIKEKVQEDEEITLVEAQCTNTKCGAKFIWFNGMGKKCLGANCDRTDRQRIPKLGRKPRATNKWRVLREITGDEKERIVAKALTIDEDLRKKDAERKRKEKVEKKRKAGRI